MKMKSLKLWLVALAGGVMAMLTSCPNPNPDSELCDHYERTAESFKNAIEQAQEKGYDYHIIDYRKESEFAAGHIPGAEWVLEGTTKNMDDGTFAATLKAKYGTKSMMFLYGSKNSVLMMTLTGSVSCAGYGKEKSHGLVGGFEAWQKAGYEVEQ